MALGLIVYHECGSGGGGKHVDQYPDWVARNLPEEESEKI